MLNVNLITKCFSGNKALDGVSFAVNAGELTAVIGPNGAGKTTLLDAISGLITIDMGSIVLDNVEISKLYPWTRARSYLGRSFQRPKLVDSLTATENVMLHFREQVGANLIPATFMRWRWRDEEARVRDRALELIQALGISELADHFVSLLSYGQKKLVALAGAMADGVIVALLDEPLTGIDPDRVKRAAAALRVIADRGGHVLVVEHNLTVVASIAERVIVLDRGKVIADGPPSKVLPSDALSRAYTR